MDQNNNVHLVEEEKFGWTILSAVPDVEPQSCGDDEMLALRSGSELLPEKVSDEPFTSSMDLTPEKLNQEKETHTSDGDQRNGVEKPSNNDVIYGDEENDTDDDIEYYELDAGDDDLKSFPLGDSARGFQWDPKPMSPKSVEKQALAGQKQGVIWRVSLVATLGFFGWVVMNGLSGGGGGKNLRLKLHPCSIQEGEPVLATL